MEVSEEELLQQKREREAAIRRRMEREMDDLIAFEGDKVSSSSTSTSSRAVVLYGHTDALHENLCSQAGSSGLPEGEGEGDEDDFSDLLAEL